MKTLAIVQARMSSTRLPGKVLQKISGHEMLWHVVTRVRKSKTIDSVVVATSESPADDALAAFCSKNDFTCFRGDENDVLDRFYQAAKKHSANAVVRITADCPLIDPKVIDKVVGKFKSEKCDYATNTIRYTYPDGLDVEVFTFAALEKAWKQAKLKTEREHVTPFIRNAADMTRVSVENEVDLSPRNLRWTVDNQDDLDFVTKVFERLRTENGPDFDMQAVLKLLEREPNMINQDTTSARNEGYYKSIVKEAPMAPKKRSIEKSTALKAKAKKLIPSCSQTFSKGPTQFVQGVAPTFLSHGDGCHVWDVDGNEYIDYPMSLGAIILGHNYPAVTDAVHKQIKAGTSFSLPHEVELDVAELLSENIPCAEMVRFGKNGSDATSGAVRAARAFTGREVIACCGYHGWQDWYIGTTTRNKGIPKAVQGLTKTFEYNKIESLEKIFAENKGNVAAVIMEPIGLIEPKDGFLQKVKDICHQNGALLIFDEIITGFRLSLGGAQKHFGVTPDLACFGKAMGNGYPIAAVVGRRDVMEIFDEIFFSFTFGGEAVSLAATKATILEMAKKNVIGHLWEQGQKLKDGFNVFAREYKIDSQVECVGLAPRSVMFFREKDGSDSLLMKSLFQQECIKRGILFNANHMMSYSHKDVEINQTLHAYRAAMEILAKAVHAGNVAEMIEGKPLEAVFRKA